MSNRVTRVPTYRCKKSTGGRKYAIVSLPDGVGGHRDVLLGRYGSKESRAEYARVIGEWEANNRRAPVEAGQDITINELALLFGPHVEEFYGRADGSATSEVEEYKLSLRTLRQMYGHILANQFGPLSLKAVRQRLIEQPIVVKTKSTDPETGKTTWTNKVVRNGLARSTVNQRVSRVKRLFQWVVENELVSPMVMEGLRAVSGLQAGRSPARRPFPSCCGAAWTYHEGSSRKRLPSLVHRLGRVDLFVHDSMHTTRNVAFEVAKVWPAVAPGGVVIADDIERNTAFASFAAAQAATATTVTGLADDGVANIGIAMRMGTTDQHVQS